MPWKRVATALLLAGLVPVLAWNGIVQGWNDSAADTLARLLPRPNSASIDRILLLAIDDFTAARYGPLPLKRDVLAQGLSLVAVQRPTALAVDLLLAEKTTPAADAALSRALEQFHKVVLAAAIAPGTTPQWIMPLADFPRTSVGHVHASPDPDGVVRSLLLEKSAQGVKYRALALEAAGEESVPAPLDLHIKYAGGEGTFQTISFADVLDHRANLSDFAGKIVVLGVSAQGAGDRRFTPVSAGLDMPGIEIHANIIRTLLDGDGLRPMTATAEFALLLAAMIVAAALTTYAGRGAVAMGFLAIPVASYAVLLKWGWIVPVASCVLAYFAAALAASLAATREAQEGRADYALRLQAIAHEIKTPLTAISASSEMVADATIPADRKAVVASLLHKESQRLAGIVSTFLDVERISAGVLRLERHPTDLADVARDAMERANLLAARKHTRIVPVLSRAIVSGDAELLGFAVYNLLSNALKYSPAGSVVTLTAASGGGTARVTVGDQGSGVEPSERARIFERFYRQRKHAATSEQGSGMGLALVKEIIAQHGGHISLDSVPGQGSRFTVEIPV